MIEMGILMIDELFLLFYRVVNIDIFLLSTYVKLLLFTCKSFVILR